MHARERDNFETVLRRAKIVRESMHRTMSEVVGDPDKEYVWVRHASERVQYFQALGYEITKNPAVQTKWRRDDGTHVRGDVILMEVDKDMKEAYEVLSDAASVEALQGSREEFINFAIQNRIPVEKIER